MMNPSFLEGNHGRFSSAILSVGVRGHLRPAHHDLGSIHVVWPGVLDDVGAGLGAGDNTRNFRYLHLSGDKEGAAT